MKHNHNSPVDITDYAYTASILAQKKEANNSAIETNYSSINSILMSMYIF
jgi:hypothetical protein